MGRVFDVLLHRMERVMPTIRREQPGDEAQIYDVNLRAFGRVAEPEVVDMLRKSCPEGVSLVAEEGGRIVGHILFTPAVIEGDGCRVIGADKVTYTLLQGAGHGGSQFTDAANMKVVLDFLAKYLKG